MPSLVVGVLAICGAAFAHESARPATTAGGVGHPEFTGVHGGYGYLASSEAEGDSVLTFGCSEEDRRNYVSRACPTPLPPGADPEAALSSTAEATVTGLLQEQVAEYMVMQAGATTDTRPVGLEFGTCIEPGSGTGRLQGALPTRAGLGTAPASATARKFASVANQFQRDNLARALMMSDQLERRVQVSCSTEVQRAANRGLCTNLQNMLMRIDTAYPSLFGFRSRAVDGLSGGASGMPGTELFRDAVKRLIGTHGADGSSAEARLQRGSGFYESAMNASSDVNALPGLERRFISAEDEAASTGAPASLRSAQTALNDAAEQLNREYLARVRADARGLCGLDLRRMAVVYPNVVRQMLLDLPAERRALVQAVLCRMTGALARTQFLEQCDGVSLAPDTPGRRELRVSRTMWDFPYSSQNNFTLSRPFSPPAAPYEVVLDVNIAADPDVTGDLDALAAQWGQRAVGYFNCQSGQAPTYAPASGPVRACPPDPANRVPPGVRFRVNVHRVAASSTAPPLLRVHRCYRAELRAPDNTNCDRVRAFRVRQECGATPTPGCEAAIPPSGDSSNNRLDSANLTGSTPPGVLLHEFGHLLGLPDEYRDDTHVFNDGGEGNSLMNFSSEDSRLYPRHLRRIMAPARCSMRSEP